MRGIHIHTGRIRPANSRVPEGRHRVGRGLAPCVAIKKQTGTPPAAPAVREAQGGIMPRTTRMPRFMPPRHPAGLSSCRGASRGEYSTLCIFHCLLCISLFPEAQASFFPPSITPAGRSSPRVGWLCLTEGYPYTHYEKNKLPIGSLFCVIRQ